MATDKNLFKQTVRELYYLTEKTMTEEKFNSVIITALNKAAGDKPTTDLVNWDPTTAMTGIATMIDALIAFVNAMDKTIDGTAERHAIDKNHSTLDYTSAAAIAEELTAIKAEYTARITEAAKFKLLGQQLKPTEVATQAVYKSLYSSLMHGNRLTRIFLNYVEHFAQQVEIAALTATAPLFVKPFNDLGAALKTGTGTSEWVSSHNHSTVSADDVDTFLSFFATTGPIFGAAQNVIDNTTAETTPPAPAPEGEEATAPVEAPAEVNNDEVIDAANADIKKDLDALNNE